MKKRIASLLALILAACLIVSSAAVVSSAAQSTGSLGETRNRNNINGNSYNRYYNVVRNYLRPTDNGYMRVYGSDNGTLLAEYYDEDFRFLSNRYVGTGLPLFGGFYECGGYYYVVTGAPNPDEDDTMEVYRITCFDKNWQECGSDSLFGAHTVSPFNGGRVAFDHYKNTLIIRTCHRLYSIEGINHQANVTIVFDTKYKYISDYFSDVAIISKAGFVSHSFNQFVTIDSDGTIVCLDHGDSHPREAVLGRYRTKADNLTIFHPAETTYEYTSILSFPGDPGENTTGAMIGGLACSSSSYLTVGTAVELNESFRTNTAFNAYLSVTDKSVADLTGAVNKMIYLTDFAEGDGRYASNPQLVKINDNKFLVMWNEFPVSTGAYLIDNQSAYGENHLMKYVFVDGKGKKLTKIMTAPVNAGVFVSDCEPILDQDRILWYVTDGEGIASIVDMDLSGRITVHGHIIPDELKTYPIDLSRTYVAFRSFDKIPANVEINASNFNDYVVVYYRGRPLECGSEYKLSATAASPVTVMTDQGTVKRISLRLSTVSEYSYFPLSYTANWSATDSNLYLNSAKRAADGVHLSVIARRGIGYHVYRKEAGTGGDYVLIGTVKDKFIDEYVDTTASRSRVYSYVVREYTYDIDGNEVLSPASSARSVSAIETEAPTDPPPTDPPTAPPTDPPTAPPTDPPEPDDAMLGDADRDGSISILDATTIQRFLARLSGENEIDSAAADVDGDGSVSILDATMIQRHLARIPTGLPIGQPMRAA